MQQNATIWEWTEGRILAAQLTAEGRLTDQEIADAAGVHRATLHRWREREEFRAKVAELAAALEAAILRTGIATRVRRVLAMDRRWRLMQRVIDERAAAPAMQAVAGGATGLLAHDVKIIGGGDSAERVDVYSVDAALLRELREIEKQAAQDLGQWTEKREHTGPAGEPLVVKVLAGALMDEL